LKEKMLFENPTISIENLPNASEVTYQPLEKDYIMVQLFSAILLYASLFIALLLVLLFGFELFTDSIILSMLLYAALFLACIGLQVYVILAGFKCKGFCIRQHDVLYRSGLIFKRQVSVPLSRIQHLEIKRGIFSRIFELASLQIFTAGSGAVDLKIPGLTLADAEKIKEHLSKAIAHEQ